MASNGLGWREWLTVLMWRAWKYLLHLVTGRCELQRICERAVPLHARSAAIAECLRCSHDPKLRRIGKEGRITLDEPVEIVLHAKKIDSESSVLARLRASLQQITSLNTLRAETEKLRAELYSQDNDDHEDMLMKLWSHLSPNVPLESRLTDQWGDIGFQGKNPATDFRGMGVLGLHCLLYFSSQHKGHARSVLTTSQHPVRGYPFAVVGINFTSLLFHWLHDGIIDHHYYYWMTDRPLSLSDFMESYCYIFHQFNNYWIKEKPENVMAFPSVKDQFAANLKTKLSNTPPTLMRIINRE